METLKVDIVSPSGQLIANKAVSMLTVPSIDGEIAILPGHIDVICLLGKGVLRLDNDPAFILYKGIMEISGGTTVIIAAERVVAASDLNKQEVINLIKNSEIRLSKESLEDKDFEQVYGDYQDHLAELSAFN
jgi:F-type H+-transporting ATPase subunit epsilon